MTFPDRQGPPPARYRYGRYLLMLPVGLIVLVVAFYLVAERGGYFPGEFLLLLVVVLAVMFLVRMMFWRSRRNYARQRWQGNEAVRILRQRYARGEITKEQFRQMLWDLRHSEDKPPDTSSGS
jgi:uncharacterized membrane protein